MSAPSGNIGEWSELYALLEVLVSREVGVPASDPDRVDFFYPVEYAIRVIDRVPVRIENIDEAIVRNEVSHAEIQRSELRRIQAVIQAELRVHRNKKGQLEIPEARSFLDFLGTHSLTASSTQLADLELGIRNPHTDLVETDSFSIKSLVGQRATLLNASGSTNFIYSISGIDLNLVDSLNAIPKLRDMLKELRLKGGSLTYSSMASAVFQDNLRFIDTHMPEIMAYSLARYFEFNESNFRDLAETASTASASLGWGYLTPAQIMFKFGSFLEAVALGLRPGTPWSGRLPVSGGLLVVDSDFNVRLIKPSNHDEFRSHLLDSTNLESSSRTRHKYGKLKVVENQIFLNLNLQVRY